MGRWIWLAQDSALLRRNKQRRIVFLSQLRFVNFWGALKVFAASLDVVFLIRNLHFDSLNHIEVLFTGGLIFKIIRVVNHAEVKSLVLCWFDPRVEHLLYRRTLYAARSDVSKVFSLRVKRERPFVFGLLAAIVCLLYHNESPSVLLKHPLA